MKRSLLLSMLIVLCTLVACSSGAGTDSGLIPPAMSDESLAGAAGQAKDSGEEDATTPALCTGAQDANTAAFTAEVITLVNAERVNAGLMELAYNPELTNAAQKHSIDMGCNFFLSHTGSDGLTYDQRIFSFGYAGAFVGENVAGSYATPAAVVNAWMNSQAHRDAILNMWFFEVGVGYIYNPDDTLLRYYHYWTMDFGG